MTSCVKSSLRILVATAVITAALMPSMIALAAEDLLWCFATGYRVKGKQFAEVTWAGSAGAEVLLFQGSLGYSVIDNDGSELIALPKGNYFQFAVCEYPIVGGVMNCSNVATVMFPK